MISRKFLLAVVAVLTLIPSISNAWEGTRPAFAPSTGSTTWWHGSQGVVAYSSFSWNLNAKVNLLNWDARFDWTADCDRIDGPQEPDQVHVNAHQTDVPNNGVYRYNDCGDAAIFEETELDIRETGVVVDRQYYWQVYFDARKTGFIDGEINISMEAGLGHWWLEKEKYWYNR
ncbi:hypothetical protein [Herpetosiphon gulosus]|uniref:Uncharacterized protein n=1 Tax=Herpetosiphon gulosus TaxID=1973496 RepID=A0ABP9WU14_9CHLR